MSALLVILHVIICLILIVAVLLQSGKAADLAGSFGGVGSQTAFGPRGATTLLAKITTAAAVVFMLTSIGLWLISIKGEKSVMKAVPAVTETQKPLEETKKEPESKKENLPNPEKKIQENQSSKSINEK
ncbi:MAG: preprotein translocase subunit SecG [Candidatus Aminicenantes bacterium]|nr:preprotein translocase subunit SecG [Candidatus Aminicenantes bacterium]